MPVLKHEAFFRQHPVFTGDELAIRVYPAIKVDYTEYWQAMGRCRITTHQDAASVIRETSVEG